MSKIRFSRKALAIPYALFLALFVVLPLLLIVSTIVTTTVNYGVLWCSFDYMSVYTREKWEKYPYARHHMLANLKEQYEFIGMTEKELEEVLGDPTHIVEYTGNTKYKGYTAYQYMIGDDRIDGYTYDFIFENGIVIDTSVSQTQRLAAKRDGDIRGI